jgi:hypothetical protein
MSQPPPAFYTLALLYRRTSTSGKTVYTGVLDGVKIFMLPCERASVADAPEWELAVKASDWNPSMKLLKKGK